MAAPKEYCVKYKLSNISNRTQTSDDYYNAKTAFTVSGNTDIQMGRITRIEFRHANTSTAAVEWYLRGEIQFADGTIITSDTQSHKFNRDLYTMANTFAQDLPVPNKWDTWTGIWVRVSDPKPSYGRLYWRADSANPMEINVYFWALTDLADDAEPPVVTGIRVSDSAGLYAKYGDLVQSKSRAVITGQYSLDPQYDYLTAKHTLVLKDAAGTTVYKATQDDNSTFQVGALRAAGTLTWQYTVLDMAGNSVTRTGTLEVLPWSAPAISALTVERYETVLDDGGNPTYIAAEDGDHVRFSFLAIATPIHGINDWTVKLAYGNVEGEAIGEVTVVTLPDGATLTYVEDRDVLPGVIDAGSSWWFTLTAQDAMGSGSMTAYVDEATAYFDVERHGISVGMRSAASDADKRFEVAEGYEGRFYGGIYGVTNYRLEEQPTGGRWIDGKPIYRRTYVFPAGAANGATIDISGLGFEMVRIVDSIANYKLSNAGDFWGGTFYWGGNTERLQLYIAAGAITLRLGTNVAIYRGAWVTVEYTKTADEERTIWVYSDMDGAVILAEQVAGSFVFSETDGAVVITAMAGLAATDDGDGDITIGG